MSYFLRFFKVFIVAIVCVFDVFSAQSATGSSPSTIILDDQGAKYPSNPSSLTYNGSTGIIQGLPLQSLPYKPGYLYAGHFAASGCVGRKIINYDGTMVPVRDIPDTLYACWISADIFVPTPPTNWSDNEFLMKKVFILDGNGGGTGSLLSSNEDVNFTGSVVYGNETYTVTFQNRGDWIYWGKKTDNSQVWFIPIGLSGYQLKGNGLTLWSGDAPSRLGYTFGGYVKNQNGTGNTIITADNQLVSNIDIDGVFTESIYTIYAKWNRIQVNLAGSGVSPSTVYLQYGSGWYNTATGGSVVTALTNPPSNGTAIFDGYYYGDVQIVNSAGVLQTDPAALTAIMNDNTTLSPRWTSSTWATLTVDNQNGVVSEYYYPLSGCSTLGYRTSQSCGADIVDSITPPVKDGWVYGGHFINPDGTGTQYISSTGELSVIRSSLRVYAKWTFNVGYDAGASTGGVAPASPNGCIYGTTCNAPANTYTAPSGQQFAGWSCGLVGAMGACAQSVYLEGQSLFGATNNVSGATGITLTPTWASVMNYWKLTLKSNISTQGGLETSGSDPYIYEAQDVGFYVENNTDHKITASIFLPISDGGAGIQQPVNYGKIFDGYYTLPGGGSQIIDENGIIKVGPSQFSANQNLYAHWLMPTAITLNAGNGDFGNCDVQSISVVAGHAPLAGYQHLDCHPEQVGYNFIGYNYNGTQYYDGNANATYEEWPMSNAPTELIAEYEPVRYAVNYYCGANPNPKHTDYVENGQDYTTWDGKDENGDLCIATDPASPSGAGSRLAGWLYSNGGITTEYGLEQNVTLQITGPINLVNVTRDIFYVALNHNEAGNTPVPNQRVYFWNGSWYDNSVAGIPRTVMNPKPSKLGYDFNGYKTENGRTVVDAAGNFETFDSAASYPITTNNSTITAQFTPHPYTVTLNRGTGTGGSGYVYYRVDWGWAQNNNFNGVPATSINSVPTPPSGYVFDGYYTEQDGGGRRVTDGNGTILVTGSDALSLVTSLSNLTFYANYIQTQVPDDAFTITTVPFVAGTVFEVSITAAGDFWVDWGDENIEHIVSIDTDSHLYSHTYIDAASSGKIIKFWGTAGGYSDTYYGSGVINFSASNALIAGVSGSIGSIFQTVGTSVPCFGGLFRGQHNLRSVSPNLFNGVTGVVNEMFAEAFDGCTSLGAIPPGLFSGVSGAAEGLFMYTFKGCTSLGAIPSGLFSGVNGVAEGMFLGTFENTGITSIPLGLFSGVSATGNATGSANYMFMDTFKNTGITALPATLFGEITASGVSKQNLMSSMFANTPLNASGQNYIPKTLFLNSSNQPIISDINSSNTLMTNIFANTGLVTDCANVNLTNYPTPNAYESYWNGKKICAPAATFTCANSGVIGNPSGTPNPTTIWADEITGSTTLPAGSGCVAPTHYTTANYWACGGNTNCTGTPSHWAAGGAKPSWLTNGLTQSVSFYMEYTPEQYTITLKRNHDNNDDTNVGTITETYATSWSGAPTIPASWSDGTYTYNFDGYFITRDNTGARMTDLNGNFVGDAATYMIGASGNWYAHWSQSTGPFTAIFRCDEGAGTSIHTISNIYVNNPDHPNADVITMPALSVGSSCTKTGYEFARWKVLGTNDVVNPNATYTWTLYGDSDVIPDWQPVETTIALDKQGGTGGQSTLYTRYNDGVYRDSNRTKKMTTSNYPITAPSKTVNITLDLNDTAQVPATITVGSNEYNNTTNQLVLPFNLEFNGYFDNSNNGTKVIYGASDSAPNFITAYGMGHSAGSGYVSPQTWYAKWGPVTIGAMTDKIPMRNSYVFTGWWTTADETGIQLTDGTGAYIDNPRIISTSETWYAHWTQCSHTRPSDSHATMAAIGAISGACAYHVTCDNPGYGYTQYGNPNDAQNFDITAAVGSYSGVLEGAKCFPRTYSIIYDNVTEHGGTLPNDAPGSYTYGIGATVSAVPTSPTEIFDSWCDDLLVPSSCSATKTISTTDFGPKTYIAKWSGCKTGYRTYNYDVWVTADYDNQSRSYSAGVCAPGNYVITCDNNCPAGEMCNACLEDFVSVSGTPLHLGQRYGVYSQLWETQVGVVGALGVVLPHGSGAQYLAFGGNAYGQSGDTSFGIRPLYSYNGIGAGTDPLNMPVSSVFEADNYVTYMTNLAQLSSQTFGRAHYTFNGLWTHETSEDSQYRYLPTVNGTTPWAQRNADGKALSEFFTSDVTVYAHWIPDVYSVTLNKNGGSFGTNAIRTIYEKWNTSYGWSKNGTDFATYTNFTIGGSGELPTRTGHAFDGYWTNSACDGTGTKIINANGTLNTSVTGISTAKYFTANGSTLYACWTPKQVTITLSPNADGAHLADNGYTTTIYTKYATGVYLNLARTQQMTTSAYPVTKPSRYFTITYYPNYDGGSTWTSNVDSVFNGYFSASSNGDKYINGDNDPAPKPGYITDAGDSAGRGYSNTNNSYVWHAQWTNGSHDLHLGVRDGYVFTAWYDAANGGNRVGEWAQTIIPTSDMILYARWEQCNYTAGDNSIAVIQPMDSQNNPNRCRYLITCSQGYTINGASSLDYYATAGVASGTLPGCSANEYTITYYDNLAYGNNIVLATQDYMYNPGTPVELNPHLNSRVFEGHRAASVQWCDQSGNNCETQLAAGASGGKIFYAKWTCDTGYRIYAYETNTHEYGNDDYVLWAAGTCAPSRYRVMCSKNCPAYTKNGQNENETCNACLEDFKVLSSSDTVGKYSFGSVYNGMRINQGSCGSLWAGDLLPVPVYFKNDTPSDSELFTEGSNSNYAIEACWVQSVDADLRSAYYGGNYKTFMMMLADESYNSGRNFGATHYDFGGLWTDPTLENDQYKYIMADGLSPTGEYVFDSQEMSKMFISDTNVYAHWVPKEYTITLDANNDATGGNMSGSVVTLLQQKWAVGWKVGGSHNDYVVASSFPALTAQQLPTRDGYSFAGYWTEQQQAGSSSCPGTKVINANGTLNTNVSDVANAVQFDNENGSTIYACWNSLSYNIFYDLNGGVAGSDHPTSATYGDAAFHVSNPVSHPHGTFKGWVITGMDGVTHRYGPTAEVEYGSIHPILNLQGHTDYTYFQNLHGGGGTVRFTARWNCAEGWGNADCSEPGAHTITIKAGYGVSSINGGTGWDGNDTDTITKSYNTDGEVILGNIDATLKGGYNGRTYRIAISGNGTLIENNTKFKVGSGDATIYIDATGINTPTALISGGTTKVYNYQNVTLTGSATNSTDYDSSVHFSYRFGESDTSDGTYQYTDTASSTNTKTIAKNAYRGVKYYKIEITAAGEGPDGNPLISSAAVSATPASVTFRNASVTFKGYNNETVATRYVSYSDGNLYDGEYSDTVATVPTATRDNYNFNGWWKTSTGNEMIYNAEGIITSQTINGFVQNGKWATTSDRTLYAQWDGAVYRVQLMRNHSSTDNTLATPIGNLYQKYGEGWSTSESDLFNVTSFSGSNLPKRTGYGFGGYYTQRTSGNQIGTFVNGVWSLPDPTTVTGTTTWYAQWDGNVYNISYNLNDGICSGADCPTTGTYGSVVTIKPPSPSMASDHHQMSFAGWNVTNMQSGITHYYGVTTSVSAHGTGTGWSYTDITPSVKYFKNLRADTGTVMFEAVWNCEAGWNPPTCSAPGAHEIKIIAGNGVGTVSGNGWAANSNSTEITRSYNTAQSIDLSMIAANLKSGYAGRVYRVAALGGGSISGNTFTVGSGDAIIYIDATGINVPTVTLSPTVVSQIYNYQNVTLMAAVNSLDYDTESVSFTYEFGYSDVNNNGSYGNWVETSNTEHPELFEIDKAEFFGYRSYKVKVTARGEGNLSSIGTSGSVTVRLNQRKVTFNSNGGTLGDSLSRYIRYDSSYLYDSATSNTQTNPQLPTVTRDNYTFLGWWTTPTGEGYRIYDANGNMTTDVINSWTGENGWAATEAKTLYARWDGNVYNLTLDRNGGTANGTVTLLQEKYGTGWRTGTNEEFSTIVHLRNNQLPTSNGQTFVGYYDAAIGGNPKGQFENGTWTTPEEPTVITGATTWYAHWRDNTYTVTYVCGIDGGAGSADTATYNRGYTPKTLVQANCNASREGMYFNGWNVTPAGDARPVGTEFTWKYTENQTFTADWQSKTYHIIFNKNNGNGGTNEVWEVYNSHWHNASQNHITTITLPNRTGYAFMGYALDGITYINNSTLPPAANSTFGDTSNNATIDVTLTAQWEPITYNISYDENGGSRSALPDGYTLLEYVSGGTFDTGLYIGTDDIFEIKYATTADSTAYHFGYRGASAYNSVNTFQATYSGSKVGLFAVNNSGDIKSFTASQTTGIPLILRWNGSVDIRPTVNGNAMSVSGSTTEQTNPSQTFVIGGEKINGTITQSSNSIKLYYFRTFASDGVSVTHNFVPVKNSSNIIGMYDTITGTFLTNSNNRTLTGENASDVQVVLDGYPSNYTYGVGATVYGVPVRAHSVFEGWCGYESSTTGILRLCQTTPYVIGTNVTGDKTLHAKWSCDAGYVLSGDACVADTIILNWNENNGNYPELSNGQCTYGGNLTLAGAPNNSNSWVFNGWKLVNNEVKTENSTVAGGCVETYTGVASGESTGITAQWCHVCNTTHATCELDATTVPGTCLYNNVECESGYHVSPDSPVEPYNMVCIPYTITYDSNGHGNGATEDALYNQIFRTNDAKDSTEFNWNNHIVTEWTSMSGGNFSNVGGEYTYNVQSDTTLQANWGECHCTPVQNGHAISCSTVSSNNECEVDDILCEDGFTGAMGECQGVNCTANCSNDHSHKIRLRNQLVGVTEGTNAIYAIDDGADSGTGVYFDITHQTIMTTEGPAITLPSLSYTVTYNVANGELAAGEASSAQAIATFNGYYDVQNGTDLYIAGDTGLITAAGVAAGTTIANNQVWYGQWTKGSVRLPVAYRPGYMFAGWFTQDGTMPVGNYAGQYTPNANVTLYAHWTKCAAGNYCPGIETVNGQTVYNTEYSCSYATGDGVNAGEYEYSVAGSDDISDCYLVLEDGKWVATAGSGKVACTSGFYCDDHSTQVYYSSPNPDDGRRTTGIRKSCAINAGSTFVNSALGATSINACYKNVTLNKRGGSGTLGGASGAYDGSTTCYYNENCTLPNASILQLVGHTFHGGWTDQADTDCNSTTRVFIVPNGTDTYYACRTTNSYTVTLKDEFRGENTTFETVNPNPVYGQPMPTPLTVTPIHPAGAHTTYVFQGYFSNKVVNQNANEGNGRGIKYYDIDLSSANNWNQTQNASLYAKWWMRCDPGYYLPAGSTECALCPAGRYCVGTGNNNAWEYDSGTNKGLSGFIAAGYYSIGGATTATPATCGANNDEPCLIAAGYYSTGGGTLATPTVSGNGCLSDYSCGILSRNYFSNGGGTTFNPLAAGNGCVSGQFCGTCPNNYQASTTTGKTNITACMASCLEGTQVVSAEDPTVNNASAAGCVTPMGEGWERWWSNEHNVYYGSASPRVTGVTDYGVHTCVVNYETRNTSDPANHDERQDCTRRVVLSKNDGTTIEGVQWPGNAVDTGSGMVRIVCQEGEGCAFGNPALLLEKPGWVFQNAWGTDSGCSGPTFESPVTTPASGIYYACKTAVDYTLTYACGTGTLGTAPVHTTPNPIHYGNTVLVAGVGDCVKTGHYFTGWGVSNSENVQQPGNMTWEYEESKTFTAQWEPITYNISYDENGGSRSALPDGYTLLEYVSGGTFDTGLYIGTDDIFEIKYATTADSTAYHFGYRGASAYNSVNTFQATYSGSKVGLFAVNNSGDIKSFTASQTTGIPLILRWNGSVDIRPTVNGNAMSVSGSTTEQTNPSQTFVIGGEKINGTITQSSNSIKLYYFRTFASDGVSVTHNFVPVKNSSNIIGMYDTITGTFLTNSNNRTLTGENASDVQVVLDGYPSNYTYGVGATVYGVPVRAHSVFEGWCRNENLSGSCTVPHEITTADLGDKTLHAKWSCDAGYHLSNDGQSCVGNQITIQYNKNGHGTGDIQQSYTCVYGDEVTLVNGLTQQGWWFEGWSVAGNTFDGGETITCDAEHLGVTNGTVALVAVWEPWCNKITLDKNNGAASYGSIRYLYAKTRETGDTNDSKWYKNNTCTVEYTSADYENVIPSRNGWGFRGFYENSSDATGINATQTNGANRVMTHTGEPTGVTGSDFINAVNTDTVLYAGWAQDCVNPVSNGTCSRTIARNTSYATTCDTGYHYDPVASESTYNPICVPNTITIILNKNGGSGTCGGSHGTENGTITCTYDGTCETPVWNEDDTDSTCFIQKARKMFAGWNTAADGTGTQYGTATVAGSVQNINNGENAVSTTLYAKWLDVTCNVENGTGIAMAGVAHNTPQCIARCDNGYETSGLYDGAQHSSVVNTGQCSAATYDITYHENGGTRVLPNGYTLLEYVTTGGDQYIDTGLIIKKSYEIRGKFKPTETGKFLYGIRNAGSGDTASATAYISGNWRWGNQSKSPEVSLNTIHTSVQNVNNIVVDGVATAYTTQSTNFETPETMLLGTCRNYDGISPNKFIGNIYEFRILDGNRDDLMNLVPMLHDSDGAVGLYDTVSGQFFTSIGSSDFVPGPAILNPYPNEYTYNVGATVYGVPVRAHSVFEGWCRNDGLTEGCTTPHEISTTDYGDKDLYAKWSCVNGYQLNDNHECVGNNVTIVYQKGDHGDGNPPFAVTGEYGSTLALADAMGDPQWTFTGWQINDVVYNEQDIINLDFDTLGVYSGNINATAQWEAEVYTVHYNCGTTWPDAVAPADSHPTTGQPFMAASASSCKNPGYRFTGWLPESDWQSTVWVDGTLWNLVNSNDPNDTDVVFTAQWELNTPSLTVTVAVPAGTTFSFKTIASGQFWVDWGDGSNADKFDSTTVTAHTWLHTYATADTYVIKIGGRASGYYTSQDGTDPYLKSAISFFNGTLNGTGIDATVTASGSEQYIVSVNGSLGSVFPTITAGAWGGQPRFYRTFKNTTAMTQSVRSLAGLFTGISGIPVPYMFAETFDGSAITGTIPAGLFPVSGAPKDALFLSTFRGCTGLTGTIPASLFTNISGIPRSYMFSRTFMGCTGLTGVPAGLFKNIGGAPAENMFSYTFNNCSHISGTLSDNLFGKLKGVPATSMFEGTFYGCTNLVGRIPDELFGDMTGAPAEYMFAHTFRGCSKLVGNIPDKLFGDMTGAPARYMFYYTFHSCSGLTGKIPGRLFGSISGPAAQGMYAFTFMKCSGLTGDIPLDLFARIQGQTANDMFTNTFNSCSGLTGFGGALFSGLNGTPKSGMFTGTFSGCTNLQGEIPIGLFGTIDGDAAAGMYYATFANCKKLTGTIPTGLFGRLRGPARKNMFWQTFQNANNITGYVPKNLFGTIEIPATVPENMMTNIFVNTNILTECPCGTTEVPSDFKPYWNSTTDPLSDKKVSCQVGLKPGEYWYGNECTTVCPLDTIDELHVGALPAYITLSEPVTTPAVNVKSGNTICYVPLAIGNGGTNSLNMKYDNVIYHADRPSDTPPAGFGQR